MAQIEPPCLPPSPHPFLFLPFFCASLPLSLSLQWNQHTWPDQVSDTGQRNWLRETGSSDQRHHGEAHCPLRDTRFYGKGFRLLDMLLPAQLSASAPEPAARAKTKPILGGKESVDIDRHVGCIISALGVFGTSVSPSAEERWKTAM